MAADLESLIRQVWVLEADDLRRLREAIDARIVQLQALPGESRALLTRARRSSSSACSMPA